MTDYGAQRRESKPFEPPPWEREQFEQLQRRRAEQEPAEPPPDMSPAEPAVEESAAVLTASPSTEPAPQPETRADAEPGVDQARIDAMMFELRAEEPSVSRSTNQARVAVAAFLLVIGTVLMLWGMAGVVRLLRAQVQRKDLAVFLSGVLLVFGVGFISLGGWLGYKAYEQRGVR